MLQFAEGKPEDYGIPAEAIQKFEQLLKKQKVRIHGYMLLAGKEIIAQKYFAPYTEQSNHRMYSITKSFVALAIGLLVKKGSISLDDKICDYFQEKLPEEGAHPWCEEMTIRDMLTMRTCYGSTTYKRYAGDDWTESFFRVKPDHIPGTVFAYDTSAAHVLGALVEKISGMKLLDYMRLEMLDELGFSKAAYIIEDPVGVSQGGSGMMSTMTDVAKVAYLCNHYGVLDGKELLPQDFMKEAVTNQVPTDLQPKLDEQFGYGFFFWMPREEGFTFFGMGGQLAVCFPQYDFCYITMADTIGSPAGVQQLHDCFFQTIYPYFMKADKSDSVEKERKACDREGCDREENEKYIFYPNDMNWESVVFHWREHKLELSLSGNTFTFAYQTDSWQSQSFLNTSYECECLGEWKQEHFILQCYVTDEEQGNIQFDFAWKDERLSVRAISTKDALPVGMEKCFQGFAAAKKDCSFSEKRII